MAQPTDEDFVKLMLEKSKKKESAEPQNRTGTKKSVSQEEAEAKLKEIQERLQKSK